MCTGPCRPLHPINAVSWPQRLMSTCDRNANTWPSSWATLGRRSNICPGRRRPSAAPADDWSHHNAAVTRLPCASSGRVACHFKAPREKDRCAHAGKLQFASVPPQALQAPLITRKQRVEGHACVRARLQRCCNTPPPAAATCAGSRRAPAGCQRLLNCAKLTNAPRLGSSTSRNGRLGGGSSSITPAALAAAAQASASGWQSAAARLCPQ